ncbi:hypothetical protein B0H13DRAFT_2000257 [Mycena leptocephala]|nr:hypothetical protein B0H13DRAFT_2000257 [Mycena leptocephala]
MSAPSTRDPNIMYSLSLAFATHMAFKRKREAIDAGPSVNTRYRRVEVVVPTVSSLRKRKDKDSLRVTTPAHPVVKPELDDEDEDLLDVRDTTPFTPRRNPQRGRKPGRKRVISSPLAISSEDEAESEVFTPRRSHKLPRVVSKYDTDDSDTDNTPRKRLCRRESHSDAEDVEVPAGDDLPSTADSADDNDLELSPPPSASRPTPKQQKMAVMEEYKNARKNRSSPISYRREPKLGGGGETSSDDGLLTSDSSASGSDLDTEGDSKKSDFIDDAEEAADTADNALGPESYARRELDDHFVEFVEYVAKLYFNPNFLSTDNTISDTERWSYEAAVKAMRQRTDAVADSMLLSTWSAPFRVTLDTRPNLIGPIPSESNDCQGCWTRGPFSCSGAGSCTLSTRKGSYNPDTFQDEPEEGLEYEMDTTADFENSAQADKLPYPPGFRLVVGARCSRRAALYHQARHYLYNIFTRVKDEIEMLRDRDEKFFKKEARVIETLHERFTTNLWNDFTLDRKQWRNLTNREAVG